MKHPEQSLILEHNTPEVILNRITPYINEKRLARIDAVISHRLEGIQLAIECPADINNVFAAMRTAEALGVGHIHIITPEGTAHQAHTVSRGASFWVEPHFYADLASFLQYCEITGLCLAGGVLNAETPVDKLPITTPLCLLLGNEHRGLSSLAYQACDIHYTIPMVGMSESMNLSVSAAISLYDTTTRRRTWLQATSDLSPDEQTRLRAIYCLNSIAPRLAKGLFEA